MLFGFHYDFQNEWMLNLKINLHGPSKKVLRFTLYVTYKNVSILAVVMT